MPEDFPTLTVRRDEFERLRDTLVTDDTVGPTVSMRGEQVRGDSAYKVFEATRESSAADLELHGTIGEGGMGIVRGGLQRSLHREVAVKTVKPGRESGRANQELLQEALVTGGLEHPNVVPVYSLSRGDDGAPVIVMKRIAGVSWLQCMERPELAPDFSEDDPVMWHLAVFEEVCRAAHFAHSRGILHRDIKPENVMLGEFGEVYLLDWGIAVTVDPQKADYLEDARDSRGVVGTPSYMAPEMASGDFAALGPLTDVYLLGATLHHALAGAPPHFDASVYSVLLAAFLSDPPEYSAEVPTPLQEICRRAMAREPAERYASAEELRQAVVEFRARRASILLAKEAGRRLLRLRELLETEGDDIQIRSVFGECRFGFEQALRTWSQNPDAHDGRRETLAVMVRHEVLHRNLRTAENLLDELETPAQDLVELVAELRQQLQAEAAEVEGLKELEREGRLSVGARSRMWGAALGVVVLTVMPLISGQLHRASPGEMSINFVYHGLAQCLVLIGVLFAFRGGLWANQVNRRMTQLITAFALSLPLFRYVSWQIGASIPEALCAEAAAYSVGYAALALMSNFNPWFGFAIYALNAVIGVHYQGAIFEITAGANFLAIGYLVVVWRKQQVQPVHVHNGAHNGGV